MMEEIVLTRDQAIELAESGVWREWSARQRALFQLRCKRLCMDFSVFHESIEATLGRPIFTHEFALNREGLYQELVGHGDAPSLEVIIRMLPPDKTIIVSAG